MDAKINSYENGTSRAASPPTRCPKRRPRSSGDFTSLRASGCSAASPVCELRALDARRRDGALDLHFAGDGFLRYMVRTIVGTLVEFGRGRPGHLAEVLAARNRARAGHTAPAHGLVLERGRYPADAARGSPA